MKPRIALFIGDPAGVGPELVARLLAESDATRSADVLLIGSRASIDDGISAAGVRYDAAEGRPALVKWRGPRTRRRSRSGRRPATTARSCSRAETGVELVRDGMADALCFAPLNKARSAPAA